MGVARGDPVNSTRLLAVAALALALATAGCDGGNGDGETGAQDAAASNPIATAAVETLETGSARVFYDALIDSPQGQYSYTAEGEVDYDAFRAHLVFDVASLPQTGSERAEVRFDGQDAYVRFPGGSTNVELPAGKEWVRISPPSDAATDQPARLAPELDAVRQDPALFLRYLVSGATAVQREQGTEDVRGVTARIYTALIDLDRVLAAGVEDLGLDEEQRARARRVVEGVKTQLGGGPIPVTVNVDEQGLVRRVLLTFDRQTAPRQFVSALTTTDYVDFGTAVDLEPPPAGRVVDSADLP